MQKEKAKTETIDNDTVLAVQEAHDDFDGSIRSLASSTAIETGRPIEEIEKRIIYLRSLRNRVTLD